MPFSPKHVSYCECFASGRYCEACNCVNCFNNRENEATRQSAVEAILERNPNAFRPKIQVEGGRRLLRLEVGLGLACMEGGMWHAHLGMWQGLQRQPLLLPRSTASTRHPARHLQGNELEAAAARALVADGSAPQRHTKGCNCKKSGCLKKYCECFQAGIFCSDICKCMDCKNYDVGGEEGACDTSVAQVACHPRSLRLPSLA